VTTGRAPCLWRLDAAASRRRVPTRLALAGSLFLKGAHFAAAIAFEIGSTNLVVADRGLPSRSPGHPDRLEHTLADWSTTVTRIGIIVGSTRPGRKAATVATWVHQLAQDHTHATVELVDLADHDLPLLDEPEYNHGPPAALKNGLDYLFAEWNDKAAGFVGYGSAGGTRAVEQLRLAVGELRIADVRSQVSLSLFDDFENMNSFAPRPHQSDAVHALLDDVVSWSEALRPVRESP
jgi:NAD(P)H-dependent FMN reductase